MTAHPVEGAPTSVTAIVTSNAQAAVDLFHANGGAVTPIVVPSIDQLPAAFNILCFPDGCDDWQAAATLCARTGAMLIVDPPPQTTTPAQAITAFDTLIANDRASAAAYFPRFAGDVAASPAIAAIWTANDVERGLWTAPAGLDAHLEGEAAVPVSEDECGTLNTAGVNALRTLVNIGVVLWGARTMAGAGGDIGWRYIQTRRTLLYIEQSLKNSLGWTAEQQNGPQLWSDVTQSATPFLTSLWAEGALVGSAPSNAFAAICDASNNPPDATEVTLDVAVALVYPAEYSVIRVTSPTAA